MIAPKWLLVGCCLIAVSTALPLKLGGLLTGDTLTTLTGLIDNTLNGLLGGLDDILKNLSAEVSQLVKKLAQILQIPAAENPLSVVVNLINQLEAIIEQLINTTSKVQLQSIIAQITKILKIADGISVESFLAKLIVQLDSLLQQILTVTSQLLKQVSGVVDDLPVVGEILNDLQVIQLVQRLIFTLKLLLFLVNLFVKLGGLGLLI